MTLSSASSARTQQLEETVAGYQSQVERLETELQRNAEELIQYKTQAQMVNRLSAGEFLLQAHTLKSRNTNHEQPNHLWHKYGCQRMNIVRISALLSQGVL